MKPSSFKNMFFLLALGLIGSSHFELVHNGPTNAIRGIAAIDPNAEIYEINPIRRQLEIVKPLENADVTEHIESMQLEISGEEKSEVAEVQEEEKKEEVEVTEVVANIGDIDLKEKEEAVSCEAPTETLAEDVSNKLEDKETIILKLKELETRHATTIAELDSLKSKTLKPEEKKEEKKEDKVAEADKDKKEDEKKDDKKKKKLSLEERLENAERVLKEFEVQRMLSMFGQFQGPGQGFQAMGMMSGQPQMLSNPLQDYQIQMQLMQMNLSMMNLQNNQMRQTQFGQSSLNFMDQNPMSSVTNNYYFSQGNPYGQVNLFPGQQQPQATMNQNQNQTMISPNGFNANTFDRTKLFERNPSSNQHGAFDFRQ